MAVTLVGLPTIPFLPGPSRNQADASRVPDSYGIAPEFIVSEQVTRF